MSLPGPPSQHVVAANLCAEEVTGERTWTEGAARRVQFGTRIAGQQVIPGPAWDEVVAVRQWGSKKLGRTKVRDPASRSEGDGVGE